MALEKAGKLHPVRDRRTNVRHFERGEVLQLARVRGVRMRAELIEGTKAAKAFAAFEVRTPLAQVVIALELTPELVRQLHAQWRAMRGADPLDVDDPRLSAEQLAKLEEASDDRALELDRDLSDRTKARRERLQNQLYGAKRK